MIWFGFRLFSVFFSQYSSFIEGGNRVIPINAYLPQVTDQIYHKNNYLVPHAIDERRAGGNENYDVK